MDIAVPSRFACLKIEDDDLRPQNIKPKEVKKKLEKKPNVKKPDKDAKPADKSISAKKPSNNKQLTTAQPFTLKKDKKKHVAQQWEEWKQKDSEIVNGNYEVDLQNAILLSKLDYEHNKELYKQLEEAAGEKEKLQAQNKKKKNKAMSLEQFLSAGNVNKNNSNSSNLNANLKSENGIKDENFFDKIQLEAKEAVTKEHIKEKRKKREANIDEVISLAQCQQKLEQEKGKVFALQLALEKSKLENTSIKERNKTLCDILGQGEMKDKADVLLELERLYSEKNELSEEVSRLHVLLEQERSKVAALTIDSHNNKHKEKKRKQKGV